MELLAMEGLSEADVAAWRALEDRAAEPNPFFSPEYALALARHVGAGDLLVSRGPGGEWLACLPVGRERAWHRAPLPHLATWRPHGLYALLGTPLLDGGRLDEAADALAGALAGGRGLFAALEWLNEGGPVYAALRRALARRGARTIVFERFERAALARRESPDYVDATVSSKHRREFRRQRRKLGEELGEVLVADRAGDPAAVDGLMEMEAVSGVASPLAADPAHAAFFREVCAATAAAGRLQLLVLSAGGRPLAYKCNLAAGDGLFMLKIAFDESLKRYSPGMQLELEMLNFFHEASNRSWMDSCADANNAMINRLWPDRRTLVTLVVPSAGARGLAGHGAVRALRAARDRANQGGS